MRLEMGAFFSRPLRLYAPKRKTRVNMANPSASFREKEVYASAVFAVNQQEYDETWVEEKYLPRLRYLATCLKTGRWPRKEEVPCSR